MLEMTPSERELRYSIERGRTRLLARLTTKIAGMLSEPADFVKSKDCNNFETFVSATSIVDISADKLE